MQHIQLQCKTQYWCSCQTSATQKIQYSAIFAVHDDGAAALTSMQSTMLWCNTFKWSAIPNAVVLVPPQCNACNIHSIISKAMQRNTQCSGGASPTSTPTAKSISFSSHLTPNAPNQLFNELQKFKPITIGNHHHCPLWLSTITIHHHCQCPPSHQMAPPHFQCVQKSRICSDYD